MADELSMNFVAQLTNGFLEESFSVGGLRVDQNDAGSHNPVLIIGTTEEVVSFGDVAVPGYAFFRNIDTDNAIHIGPQSAGALVNFITLLPGEFAVLRLHASVIVRAKADDYPSKLKMLLLED